MKRLATLCIGLVGLVGIAALGGCADGGRFAGLHNCSADGSVVWWEYPSKDGSYDGLNNSPQNCAKRA